MKSDFENLSENILRYRHALGMTQETLAFRLGVTAAAVSKWERKLSCPDISLLPQVAELFGVSIDDLFASATQDKLLVESVPWEDDGVIRVAVFEGQNLCTTQVYVCPRGEDIVLVVKPNDPKQTRPVGHHTPSTHQTPPE